MDRPLSAIPTSTCWDYSLFCRGRPIRLLAVVHKLGEIVFYPAGLYPEKESKTCVVVLGLWTVYACGEGRCGGQRDEDAMQFRLLLNFHLIISACFRAGMGRADTE